MIIIEYVVCLHSEYMYYLSFYCSLMLFIYMCGVYLYQHNQVHRVVHAWVAVEGNDCTARIYL